MSRERTLLERISDPRADEPRTIEENTNMLANSVLRHLQKMLNTRQGFSETLPDYGLPDLVDLFHSFPTAIGIMEKAIKSTIEKYEPRLRNVRVQPVDSESEILTLRFEIKADLVTSRERAGVLFETQVDSNGEVSVSL